MAGGVVFRVGEETFFLSATVASKILPVPAVTRVPGAPPELIGLTLVDGEAIPVVDLRANARLARSPARSRPTATGAMLVCNYLGERLALVGLDVVATGHFEAGPAETIVYEAQNVGGFDVGTVVVSLREGRWAV